MNSRFVLIALLLAGCATTAGEPDNRAAAGGETRTAAPASAGDLPPLGEAEDVGGSEITPPITGDCGMESLQHYVGQPRVNVPRSAMPENYRVVGPDTMVTMDYRPDRLTVRVDENDVVESMACG